MVQGEGKQDQKPEETENLWDKILKEASRSVADRLESKHVLLLGDRNAGKSTLLARLQGLDIAEMQRGFALDYSFLDIHSSPEADEDPVSRINVWQLEGEPAHRDLLRFAISETNISNSMVVIALDFSQPWHLVESLNRWLDIVKKHITSIMEKLPVEEAEELKRYLVYDYQQYVEPTGQSHTPAPLKQLKKKKAVDEQSLLPLAEGVLTNNLGVPIVVVCCKSDMTETLEKEFGYKEAYFDFIQQYLRRICLSYGASLIYVSAKKDKNCDVLLQYLRHKLYGFDFVHKIQLVEKDSILMPAGADSMTKIQVDFEVQNLTKDPEEPFEEVIKIPKRLQILNSNKNTAAALVMADDDQEFLSKYKDMIDKEALDTAKEPKLPKVSLENTLQPTGQEIRETTASPSKPVVPVDTKPPPPSPITTSGVTPDREHEVLANFFNSLINKPGAPAGRKTDIKELKDLKDLKIPARSGAASPSLSNREDVAKQLDRIRNKFQSN